jgi:membrane-bound lytic murein transglycosylase D
MKSTGKSYQLEINNNVDERNHLEKSTRAACEYLKDSYNSYSDWPLVAASYNMGAGGVNKNLRNQNQDNYWDLNLNSETSRYVYRILAVKEIMNNAGKYGFRVRPKDLYQPYDFDIVKVDTTINDLVTFSEKFGLTYKELKELNPWMTSSSLSNKSGKEYEVKILKKN